MCREPISKDADPLRYAAQPIELQNAPDFTLTTDLKTLQMRMANLYMHQMQRGGIIDENAEESNVISIQSEDASEQVQAFFSPFFVSSILQMRSNNFDSISAASTKVNQENSKKTTTNGNAIESSTTSRSTCITKCNNGEK